MATPRKALSNVKNSLLGSAVKQVGKENILNFGAGTPKRGFGDSKELTANLKEVQKKLPPKFIDFEETNELNSNSPIKKFVDENEEYPPVEKCSCNHDHRTKEKYMLLDSEPQFEVIEVDAPVFDEWLNYYTQIEAGIESWSNFLASNDLI